MGGRCMRILIIDDNAAMRKVLAALFSTVGHDVVGALEDGQLLENSLRSLQPDLVCLDYNLPGRDGLALLRIIQSMAPEVDVVFMTASSEAGLEARAADAGASGFIRKPFGQQQIMAELNDVADARALARKAAAAGGGRSGRARGTAVIADDTGSVRIVLKGLLEECGLKVVQAVSNGSEAVQAARTHKPRLLCLDINMPVLGGMDALPKILEASPDTAVVMVTGCPDKQLVAEAATLGARGYILKPLRPAYVEGFVRKLLGD